MVRQILRSNELQKRIPEKVLIIAVVEAPFQFIKVGIKVFDTNFVIGSHDRPLQEADALGGVPTDTAPRPLSNPMKT